MCCISCLHVQDHINLEDDTLRVTDLVWPNHVEAFPCQLCRLVLKSWKRFKKLAKRRAEKDWNINWHHTMEQQYIMNTKWLTNMCISLLYKDNQGEPIHSQFFSVHFQRLKDLIKAIQSEEPGWTCIWSLSKLSKASIPMCCRPCSLWWSSIAASLVLSMHHGIGKIVSTLASWNLLTEVPNKRTSFPPPHQSQSLVLRFWCGGNWANGWRVSSMEIQVESIHSGLVPGAKGGWEKTKWQSDSIPSNVGNVDQVWDLSTWKVDKMQCKMVKSEA